MKKTARRILAGIGMILLAALLAGGGFAIYLYLQASHVVEEAGTVHGAFAFLVGEDPTYQVIEGGAWKSAAPYGTLHRVAGDGEVHGLFGQMVAFAWANIPHLRIDTHENNAVMRRLIEKYGFAPCGIIYTDDGSPRLAFERI